MNQNATPQAHSLPTTQEYITLPKSQLNEFVENYEAVLRRNEALESDAREKARAQAANYEKRDKTIQWYRERKKKTKLTQCQFKILTYLEKSTRPQGDYAQPKIETIANSIGYSERHVKRSMKALNEDLQIVYMEHRRNPKTGKNGIARYWPYYMKAEVEFRQFKESEQRKLYAKNQPFQGDIQGDTESPQLYRYTSNTKTVDTNRDSAIDGASTGRGDNPVSLAKKVNNQVNPHRMRTGPMPCDGVGDESEIFYPGKGNNHNQVDDAEEYTSQEEKKQTRKAWSPLPLFLPSKQPKPIIHKEIVYGPLQEGNGEKSGIHFPGKGRIKPTRLGSYPSLQNFRFHRQTKKPGRISRFYSHNSHTNKDLPPGEIRQIFEFARKRSSVAERHKPPAERPKRVKIKGESDNLTFTPEEQEELIPGSYELWKQRQKIKN